MAVGTVLVTGGAGYIGSFTALALLEAGYKVVIVDNLYNASKVVLDRIELICGKRPEFHCADITDEKALDDVFGQYDLEGSSSIDCVVHFAALKVQTPFLLSRQNRPENSRASPD
jgi:UDP-glucose 4-epimerase